MAAVTTNYNNNGVATVTLSRPSKHNAFDDQTIDQLSQTFDAIDDNDNVKLMVLAAQGKSFSAGADLGWMKRMAEFSYEENLKDARNLANMLRTLNQLSKPTIARVQGAAFGGAVGLVSCCDIAVGSRHAKFCLSEVKIGLVPATISPYVIGAIGQRAARRFFLTAETIDATMAVQLGLLSTLVEEDKLDHEVTRFCELLLSHGHESIKASKQLIYDVAHRPLNDELVDVTSRVIANARVSTEAQARLNEFLTRGSLNKGDKQ